MSKGAVSVIVLFLILALTAVFFFSPSLIFREKPGQSQLAKDLISRRLTSLGNSVAHSAFVEDAVIMGDGARLSEIVTRLRKDEPELTFVHITDSKYQILASSDSAMMGKTFSSNILTAGSSNVVEHNGLYEGGFSIDVGQIRVGALYFGINPRTEQTQLLSDRSPMIVVLGFAIAFVAFFAILISRRRLKAKLINEMARRQEEIFSPKIEALRKAQSEAQNRLNEVNENIKNAEVELQRVSDEYDTRKKEAESDPLVQSVEKLRSAEVRLIKHIDELKEEESQLNTEIGLLSQKREEVLAALENEKKEERTLHEKLDLIKKKILHLETPRE